MPDTLVLLAHPAWHRSRVHRALAAAARTVPGTDGVVVRDLAALYPDFIVDVAAEQAALMQARTVVWQHPIQWYGMPALMKLWVDEVLTHGWAYGPGGTALQGKALWLVTSTGGPAAAYSPQGYNQLPFSAFLPPYEQTARLCGLRFLPPWVIHGAGTLDEAALHRHAQEYAQRLSALAREPDQATADQAAPCAQPVPDCDRPALR